MHLIYAPMAILIEYPWLAALIGAVVVGLGVWRRRRIAVLMGGVWLVYAVYETGMKLRWLCSGECNIRIDLLVLYPLLLIALVVAGVGVVRR